MKRVVTSVALLVLAFGIGVPVIQAQTAPSIRTFVTDALFYCGNFAQGWRPVVDATFGYESTFDTTQTIRQGDHNFMFPGTSFRGQPTQFTPGRTERAFTTRYATPQISELSWYLDDSDDGNDLNGWIITLGSSFDAPPSTTPRDDGFGGTVTRVPMLCPVPARAVEPPRVFGEPSVGETLSTDSGKWSGIGVPSLEIQWERHNPATGLWEEIPAATGTTYVPVAGDTGFSLRVSVEGTNGTGTALSSSLATAPVAGISPRSIDFGSKNVGGKSVRHTVTLRNTSSDPITVEGVPRVGPAAGDFKVPTNTCAAGPIAAGASCQIQVVFAPSATGERRATMYVFDGLPGSPHAVELVGVGT